MGNVSQTPNMNELNKSDDDSKRVNKHIEDTNNYKSRHRHSMSASKDTKQLRAQYFNKLNDTKAVERYSIKAVSPIFNEFSDLPELNHSFAGRISSPLRSIIHLT
jgi:hypothetical protein